MLRIDDFKTDFKTASASALRLPASERSAPLVLDVMLLGAGLQDVCDPTPCGINTLLLLTEGTHVQRMMLRFDIDMF